MNSMWHELRRELSLILGCALALTTASYAQSRETFRQDFGMPVTETYLAPNDIMVAVQFNSHGDACSIRIFPTANSYNQLTGVTQEKLDAVLDKYLTDKGQGITGGPITGSCDVSCSGNFEVYDNVLISRIVLPNTTLLEFEEVFYRRDGCEMHPEWQLKAPQNGEVGEKPKSK